jgi:hypothetical protein
MMIKVGVIGEDPYDTLSVINLLSRKYTQVRYKQLGKKYTGCQLDSEKFFKNIDAEIDDSIQVIICTRDLDAFISQKDKVSERDSWFARLNVILKKRGIFLLNVYELEALIIADIATFNHNYYTEFNFTGDPARHQEPKETLMSLTRKNKKQYKLSHCPEIFRHLNIDTIEKNCLYFKEFLARFSAAIS